MKIMKRKKSRAVSTRAMARNVDAVSVQVSIIGPGVSNLTPTLARQMTEDFINGKHYQNYEVRIKVWRGGHELDWQSDNPRAENLRKLIRERLRDGRIQYREVGNQ